MGHGATKGYSSVCSPSRTFGDYSSFDSHSWPHRSADNHRKLGMEWKHAQTLADRDKIERDHGISVSYFATAHFSG